MNTVKDLELISEEEVRRAIKVDLQKGYHIPHNASEKERTTFENSNCLNYYVCCNTWLMLLKEYDRYFWITMKNMIIRDGLIECISMCQDLSMSIIRDEPVTDPILHNILRISRNLPDNTPLGVGNDRFAADSRAIALLLLRYPKRLTLVGATKTERDTIIDFVQTENATKMKQRREHPYLFVQELRQIINGMVDWNRIIKDIDNLTDHDLSITSGSALNANQSLLSKLECIAKSHPEFFVNPFGIPYCGAYVRSVQGTSMFMGRERRDVKVQAVPKSYKSARIIAMEDVWRQARCKEISKIIRKYTPEYINVEDQERNQLFAQFASLGNEFATLDASHASDMISKTLVREIFPPEFLRRIEPLIGTHCLVNGERKAMQMFSTAGNSLTFDIETMVYAAIAILSVKYSFLSSLPSYADPRTGTSMIVSVYGDDVILPSSAFDAACHFYSIFGLKINEDKSFYDSPFRESCGEDWYAGDQVSSLYYPRFPVVGSLYKGRIRLSKDLVRDSYRGKIDDSTTMLISLQQKLFSVCYPASVFLANLVRMVKPSISSSEYGSDLPDLWDHVEIGKLVIPKAYELVWLGKGSKPRFLWEPKFQEVPLPREVEAYMRANPVREHLFPAIRYRKANLNDSQERLLNNYNYQEFLRNGPRYASELDRLLGISERPVSPEQAFGDGKLDWTRKF